MPRLAASTTPEADMSITIHLRADGVSLLLHTDGGLPEARYWGADLGELTATD
ncbi:MAG TPA: hypothetical protein GX013_09045, partial [Propionibacterium sp.]|nr:hypothetical protein [Propionibacterium sp.]